MSFGIDNHKSLFISLFPKGKAWKFKENSNFSKLLSAFAVEYARLDSRVDDLIEEVDPRTTNELISAWESLTGFPDTCISSTGETLSERRDSVVRRLTQTGSLSKEFFISMAKDLGYEIVIKESHPFRMGINSNMGTPLRDPGFQYVWDVFTAAFASVNFKMGVGQMGDPLVKFAGFSQLGCIFGSLKPAQTNIFFSTF